MQKDLSIKLDSESLKQLATEQLAEIIIEQAIAIEQLKSRRAIFFGGDGQKLSRGFKYQSSQSP